jgi:hypothetical protein
MPPLTDFLHEWRDFFTAIVAASATLMGAMFVVMSIGIGFFTRDHTVAIRSFLTATVIHLAAVMLVCVFTMVPALDWRWFGIGLGALGLAGLGYSGTVAFDVGKRRELEWVDHVWYGAAPVGGYAALVAAAVLALMRMPLAVDIVAIAIVLLLIAGIRNAWDMIVFLVAHERKNQ